MRRTRGGLLLASVGFGLAFGYTISRIGFADYAELHRMFTFQDLRMLLTFAGAVALAGVLSLLFLGRPALHVRPHRGTVLGALMFGAGWAVSGGCPAIPIVQLAAGYLPAVATLAGVVVGMWACRVFTSRYYPVDTGSCG